MISLAESELGVVASSNGHPDLPILVHVTFFYGAFRNIVSTGGIREASRIEKRSHNGDFRNQRQSLSNGVPLCD